MKKNQYRHLWAVHCPDGEPIAWSLRQTQRDAVLAFCGQDVHEWPAYRREGLRCKKITIIDGWKEVVE